MTFYDYYLRGSDERALRAILESAGLLGNIDDNEGGQLLHPTEAASVDWIGAMYDDATAMPLAGWHANLRLDRQLTDDEIAALRDVLIDEPASPCRVWA